MDQIAPTPPNPWAIRISALLGSLVVTIGFWVMWGELSPFVAAFVALGIAVLLLWSAASVSRVWAWTTLLLGVESLAWPVLTMIRVRMMTREPTDQQMGDILTSILFGLFSAIFWMSFAYGIFQWGRRQEAGARAQESGVQGRQSQGSASKKRRRQ